MKSFSDGVVCLLSFFARFRSSMAIFSPLSSPRKLIASDNPHQHMAQSGSMRMDCWKAFAAS